MANTYTQIHIQTIFAVKKRTGLIQKQWEPACRTGRDELYKYITGIIQTLDHKQLAINGMPDHVFFGMRPIQSLSDLLQDMKYYVPTGLYLHVFCLLLPIFYP